MTPDNLSNEEWDEENEDDEDFPTPDRGNDDVAEVYQDFEDDDD